MLALEKLRLQIAERSAHNESSEPKGWWSVRWETPLSRRDLIRLGLKAGAFAPAQSSAKQGPLRGEESQGCNAGNHVPVDLVNSEEESCLHHSPYCTRKRTEGQESCWT